MDHSMKSTRLLFMLLLIVLLVSYSSVDSFLCQQHALNSITLRQQQTHRFMIDDKVVGTLSSYVTMKRGKVDVNRPNKKIPQFGTGFSYSMPSSSSSLQAFLPPGGGGGRRGDDNNISQIKDIGTIALVLGGIFLFFISPLGALFFTVLNSLLILSFVVPLIGILSFTIWSYFSTITGICPNCGTPVKVPKDESPSLCLNCGTILQSKNGIIAVANLNNDGGMFQQQEGMNDDIFSFFRSQSQPPPPPPPSNNIFGRDGGRNGRRPSIDMYDENNDDDDDYDEYQRRQRMQDRIIDVDIELDEPPPPRRRWF